MSDPYEMLTPRERQQFMTDYLHWCRVGERLRALGLLQGGDSTTLKAEELLKESAALGIFPDTSEESCRSFLCATGFKGGELDDFVSLWMNIDSIEADMK